MKLVAAVLVLLAWSRPGRADPKSEAECEAMFGRAVELAGNGKLLEASSELTTCERSCSDAIRQRCMMRSELIAADTPTIVLSVTDDEGAPVAGVRVSVDRVLVASKLDGRAIPIEPGEHEVTFSRGDDVIARKKLLILQGQRNRVVAVSTRPETSHASAAHVDGAGTLRVTRTATRAHRGSYVPSYIALGAGVTSLAGAALFTTWGRGDNRKLTECSPNCPQASVDHIHRLYLAADVSLGVGIASLAVGSWLAWRTHAHHAIAVQPMGSGVFASYTGEL